MACAIFGAVDGWLTASYSQSFSQDPTAKRLSDRAHYIEMAGGAGSSNGTGGMLTSQGSDLLATEFGVPV